MRVWPHCQSHPLKDDLRRMKPVVLRFVRLSFAFILAAALCGCASFRHTAQRPVHGNKQAFAAPFDQTWRAAIDAVYANRLTILTTNLNREGGFISAERGLNFTSVGQNVTIWVTSASPTETFVEIGSRQKLPVGGWPKNWESPILLSVGAELGQVPLRQLAAQGTKEPPRAPPPDNSGASGNFAERVTATSPVTPGKSQSVLDLEQRREELRTYKVLRTEELRLEKDAARRQRLQSEVDYLTTELASIEKRLSK